MDTLRDGAILLSKVMTDGLSLSVIIVCKNAGPKLHAALQSVWEQREAEVELIVVDGDSTDGSREWLDRERGRISTVISEPDNGVYDAMNKGIASARGDWLLFLGSDDRLATNSVLAEAKAWMLKTHARVVGGEAVFTDNRIYRLESEVNPIKRNFIHHQAAFYHRTVFTEFGMFDPSLTVMADYEFNLRLWKGNVRFEPIHLRVAICGVAGLSDSGHWRGYSEEIRVRHRHFSSLRCVLWDAGSIARFVRKKIVRSFLLRHG